MQIPTRVSPPMRRTFLQRSALGGVFVALGGCGLGPTPRPPSTIHDFGIAPAPIDQPARIRASLAVPDAIAPGWLDSNSIIYRFAYVDGGQPRVYSRSRWAGTPPEMITARLRARVAAVAQPGLASSRDGVQSDYLLRVELDEFSQVFDSPQESKGVVRARATLIAGIKRATLFHRAFSFERPAPTQDAPGAAASLTAASTALIDALIDWIVASLPPLR
ncbi:MAG: membrane integrity-associated transporter subunit PqiC [Proteobacteria bacterium]|nr:membrane integrity-associated transporter subunit PqiC [Burkholderiales bacterium]